MKKLLYKPGCLHKMQGVTSVHLHCQALTAFLTCRSAQLHKYSQQSQGKWSTVALGTRLHPRILIIFILMCMSECIGSNLVLPKSLEWGQLTLSSLCKEPRRSNIMFIKSSVPQGLGMVPYSHGWDSLQWDMYILREKWQQKVQNYPTLLATCTSFWFPRFPPTPLWEVH